MFDIMFSIMLCLISLCVTDEIQSRRNNTLLVHAIDCVSVLTFTFGVLYLVYFISPGPVSIFSSFTI